MNTRSNNTKYQDFILSTPEAIKIIRNDEILKMIKKHSIIVSELRKGPMTVKEIHQLYHEPDAEEADDNGYLVSLKTIYRRLKKLSKIDLVQVAGHRKTQGSNFTEKLYSRTAKVFFVITDQNLFQNWDSAQKDLFGERAIELIRRFFDVPVPKDIKPLLKEVLGNFPKDTRTVQEQLAEKASKDEKMAEVFVDLDIQEISALVSTVTTFITLADKSEDLYELLQFKRKRKRKQQQ